GWRRRRARRTSRRGLSSPGERSVSRVTTRWFGERIRRNEDPRLLTGGALFVDDVQLPQTAHVAFVRSSWAHGRLRGVDTSAALRRPGVLGAWTADDLGD